MLSLYADSEFDGHNGPLLSLALAGDDGSQWYGVFAEYCNHPWVAEHVAPKLYAMKPTIQGDYDVLRFSLKEYLSARSDCVIWADWPADFEHLCRLMCGQAYDESFLIPCTLRLLVESDPKPEIPHNALSDAIALRDWHQAQTKGEDVF